VRKLKRGGRMNDDKIYVLIKSRKENGLSLLMDKYGGLLVYIVKNRGDFSEEDIAECMNDILLTIWKRINKYDKNKSSFKTWIIMIARGCAVDYLRKTNKHKKTVSINDVKELYFDDNQFNKLSYNRLIELLQELPPPDNDIFYHRFVLGESVKEIAKILGLTVDNIYKRISRGKKKFKNLLIKEGDNNV
jgi:RNA polymerase sigma-70 factor (ECF subfamily)